MTIVASHYVRPLPFHSSKPKVLTFQNQCLRSTALWRNEDFSQRAVIRTTDPLMLGSFNLRCYTSNVGPFPKEGSVLQTFDQKIKIPHWLCGCLALKRPTSVGPF